MLILALWSSSCKPFAFGCNFTVSYHVLDGSSHNNLIGLSWEIRKTQLTEPIPGSLEINGSCDFAALWSPRAFEQDPKARVQYTHGTWRVYASVGNSDKRAIILTRNGLLKEQEIFWTKINGTDPQWWIFQEFIFQFSRPLKEILQSAVTEKDSVHCGKDYHRPLI